ncbi:response regulator transcription factor [Candidatus Epulonipiscium viviparus]|uniref:response regulator transcription factor n=1 Tax=Candidatus Epulonipiscium viviparus TaxID=420336 RepID=UPI0027380CB5|nr:response regulator transcription factor [Candidatus Epulopiscium viviparus]
MKIYIADDEKNIRDIICSFLKSSGYDVLSFDNGDSLVSAFQTNPADMVILDVMMPGTDGISICHSIRQKSNVPIVIVSAKDTELDRITGITMGADDYLIKPFAPMELVVRVNSIFRRMSFNAATTNILNFGNITIDIALRTCSYSGHKLDLTPTEFVFMAYMFEHSDKAVSRDELLKNVWKFDYDVDTKACDDLIRRLRKKLVKTSVRIVSVWGYGFKLETEE